MPTSRPHVIYLQPEAPPKPAEGAPCNGCGVCCAVAPCPLGVVVSRRRTGACVALRWSAGDGRYWCGMVADPAAVVGARWRWSGPLLRRLARRWIAAGIGCDAALVAEPVGQAEDAATAKSPRR